MTIDKSPPWEAISWAEKYPNDPTDPDNAPEGLTYWIIQDTRGYTVASEWMTEDQAKTIAAAPELLSALELLVADIAQYEAWQRPCHALDVACAAIAKARKEPAP